MNRLHQWYCRSAPWQRSVERLASWTLETIDLGDRVLELGPGYGVSTRCLTARGRCVIGAEPDRQRAAELRRRQALDDVVVVRADAAQLPFESAAFSSVVAFSMLHHVNAVSRQNLVFQEAARVLRPGGTFAGFDVESSWALRLWHLGDTFVPLAYDTLASRLSAAGFQDMAIDRGHRGLRFRARSPAR